MKIDYEEAQLYRLYEELNARYFNKAIYVQRVRYGKFLRDAFDGGITYGVYLFEVTVSNGSITRSEIIVNAYLLMHSVISTYPWFPEVVIYHELCHAHLGMNTQLADSKRGQIKCAGHGPDFQALMRRHPLAERAETLVQGCVGEVILREARYDALEYMRKRPQIRWKINL